MPDDPVQRLRTICAGLPEVSERLSHGEPTFFVGAKSGRGKVFVMLDIHHHGADHVAFTCPAAPGAQEELIAADPGQFFRPAYVGHRGWVGVRIDQQPDWDEIGAIVADAYRHVAPKGLVARLDGAV